MNRRQALFGASLLGMQALAKPVLAREPVKAYPVKPVTLVVGFASGGPTDSITRLLADLLGKHYGTSFVVENRLGANGTVAAQHVASAKPDGYTLLLGGSGTMVVAPNLNEKVRYDTMRDFKPIARVSDYPYFLVVPNDSPIDRIETLINMARSAPGKMSYASAGVGAGNHLAAEWFKAGAGINAVHVPYKGDAAALVDVIAGRVDFAFLSGVVIAPHVKSGKLRVLGVSSLRENRADPGVPLVSSAAKIKDFAVEPWTGIFAPAGIAPEIVMELSHAINKTMQSNEAVERLASIGQFPFPGTPEEFDDYLRREYARWADVIKQANIPIEKA